MTLHNYNCPVLDILSFPNTIKHRISACTVPTSLLPGLVRAATLLVSDTLAKV